ncbi:MAG TPA: hypothetical protein VGO80_16880 [Solirubrobacteraceae bacterium]|jgi:hypothetical protein|nr:hypothetical protein [Solirubrobacteraceae bacterium]
MDLFGGWIRQLLGAGMVAALVPLAMLAALVVVVAGSGGFGGLGSLGQLVTGPEISKADAVAAATPADRSRDLALVAPRTIVAAVPPSARPGAAGGSRREAGDERTRPPARRGPLAPPVVALPPLAPVPPAPVASAPPAPPKPTSSAERVVDGLAETVGEVVGVVGEVIGGVAETLGGILGGPPPRR